MELEKPEILHPHYAINQLIPFTKSQGPLSVEQYRVLRLKKFLSYLSPKDQQSLVAETRSFYPELADFQPKEKGSCEGSLSETEDVIIPLRLPKTDYQCAS